MWRDGRDLLVSPLCFDQFFFIFFFQYTLHLTTCLSDLSTSTIHNNKNVCLSLFQSTKCQHMWRSVGGYVCVLWIAVQSTDIVDGIFFIFVRDAVKLHTHTHTMQCAHIVSTMLSGSISLHGQLWLFTGLRTDQSVFVFLENASKRVMQKRMLLNDD